MLTRFLKIPFCSKERGGNGPKINPAPAWFPPFSFALFGLENKKVMVKNLFGVSFRYFISALCYLQVI
jgi:hypothetical protein